MASRYRPSGWVDRADPRVRWGAVVAVAAGIFVASVVDPPGAATATPPGPLGLVGADKWVHALSYAALAGATAHALADRSPRSLVVVFLCVVLYGVGIELVQSTLPARAPDRLDALANAAGAAAAVVAWRVSLSPERDPTSG